MRYLISPIKYLIIGSRLFRTDVLADLKWHFWLWAPLTSQALFTDAAMFHMFKCDAFTQALLFCYWPYKTMPGCSGSAVISYLKQSNCREEAVTYQHDVKA